MVGWRRTNKRGEASLDLIARCTPNVMHKQRCLGARPENTKKIYPCIAYHTAGQTICTQSLSRRVRPRNQWKSITGTGEAYCVQSRNTDVQNLDLALCIQHSTALHHYSTPAKAAVAMSSFTFRARMPRHTTRTITTTGNDDDDDPTYFRIFAHIFRSNAAHAKTRPVGVARPQQQQQPEQQPLGTSEEGVRRECCRPNTPG